MTREKSDLQTFPRLRLLLVVIYKLSLAGLHVAQEGREIDLA